MLRSTTNKHKLNPLIEHHLKRALVSWPDDGLAASEYKKEFSDLMTQLTEGSGNITPAETKY